MRNTRVLMIHNRYQVRGGEDESTDAEVALLRSKGHDVVLLEASNDLIHGSQAQLRAAVSGIWNHDWYRKVREELSTARYDILHVQNFFPMVSPAVYYAAAKCSLPVVQAVRNYRLVCPSANLFRAGAICKDCVSASIKWRGVQHACFRGSRAGTLAVSSMLAAHQMLGSWDRRIGVFAAISSFVKEILVEGGLSSDRIEVKPNFVNVPTARDRLGNGERDIVLYVGRLTLEKGVHDLLRAWEAADLQMQLVLVGEGPLNGEGMKHVTHLGRRDLPEVYNLMKRAVCVAMPGVWPEPFGRVAIEAFAHGTPVIGSNAGGLAEIVKHGWNGWTFKPGDVAGLTAILQSIPQRRAELANLGRNGYSDYQTMYAPEPNYARLMEIYRIASNRGKREARST